MTRLNLFFDRLSRNDVMRSERDKALRTGRTQDTGAELTRARRVYRGIYYI